MHKLLVVSDSHGASEKLLAMLASAVKREGVSRLIHLGDGERDGQRLAALMDLPLTAVRGNCDDPSALPGEVTLTLGGVKLLMRHGHRLGVKSTLIRLLLRARELDARMALYGHTHLPRADIEHGILLLNPGALMDGRYALLRLDAGAATYELRTLALVNH